MDLTREQALKLHRQMWNDMKEKLGDNPPKYARQHFKIQWCKEHFPYEGILSACFLCEYVKQLAPTRPLRCHNCPINWGKNEEKFNCQGYSISGNNADYRYDAISKILELPERKVSE